MEKLVGSYSVICLTGEGDIFGFRDPDGIRPLCLGKRTSGRRQHRICISEANRSLLTSSDFTDVEDVQTGELVCISKSRRAIERKIIRQDSISPCMFEWVYFARVESEIDSTSVYNARFKLGQVLAQQLMKENITADVVVPVPETSRCSAIAVAETMGIPFRELLIKNRYVNEEHSFSTIKESRQEAYSGANSFRLVTNLTARAA